MPISDFEKAKSYFMEGSTVRQGVVKVWFVRSVRRVFQKEQDLLKIKNS